jgi:hypothetical protein
MSLPLHVSVYIYDHLQGPCEPPEDGRKYGPKHVGATSLKYFFKIFLSVLSINVN